MAAPVVTRARSAAHLRPVVSSRQASGPRLLRAAAVLVALAVGVALRAWYLSHTPVNSDEAVVGLMAERILHGHLFVFYSGQVYGGAEFYVVAAMFAVFGASPIVLQVTSSLLWAVVCLLTWRVTLRLVTDRRLAALAGALVWAAPLVAVSLSSAEYGFRNVTAICGMTVALFALRLLDGRRHPLDFVALGLAAGVGWWSSPEIAYFLVPGALLAAGAVAASRGRPAGRWLSGAVLALAAAGVGALPWIWANLHSGFASVRASSLSPPPLGFHQRLVQFFTRSLPMELNVPFGFHVLHGSGGVGATPTIPELPWQDTARHVALIVVGVIVVAAVLRCLLRRDRSLAFVAAVAAFPLIYAANPPTWFWTDGRYAIFLAPLLAPLLAAGADRRRRASPRRSARLPIGVAPASLLVLVAAGLSVYFFNGQGAGGLARYADGWGGPNAAQAAAVDRLAADGLGRGYADYWVAYRSDFVGGGRVAWTTTGNDPHRSAYIDRIARSGRSPAWLFEAPFGGPVGLTQPAAETWLRSHHVPFRVVVAGPITALVPAVAEDPAQVPH